MLGGDQLFVIEKFDAAGIVDVIERHRITTFTATPTMLQRIADLPGVDERDLSSIEWIMQGAAPMPPSLVHRWADLIGAGEDHHGVRLDRGLGLTVLNGARVAGHTRAASVGASAAPRSASSTTTATRSPTGEIGHIFMRSPDYVGATYLGEAPADPMTDDGFGTVGDMGYLDDDGYLYLVDRRVDLIITGGANVFPAEVEAALSDHPKIADVVVVGLKDPEWGDACTPSSSRPIPPTRRPSTR